MSYRTSPPRLVRSCETNTLWDTTQATGRTLAEDQDQVARTQGTSSFDCARQDGLLRAQQLGVANVCSLHSHPHDQPCRIQLMLGIVETFMRSATPIPWK